MGPQQILLGIPGGLAAFIPTDIAGLKMWLGADAITGLSDTDPVSTWSDQSGNGNDATASLTARPLYRTNILNGKPAIRFDGSNDVMTTSFNFPLSHTCCIVYTQISKSMIGNNYLFRSAYWWPNTSTIGYNLSTTIFGMTNLIVTTWNGSNAGKVYLNTTDITTGSTTNVPTGGPVKLGNSFDGYYQGDLMEILVYDTILSSTDRGSVETYLKNKYAI